MEQEPIAGPSTAKDISNGPAMSGDKSLTKLKAPPVKFRTSKLFISIVLINSVKVGR